MTIKALVFASLADRLGVDQVSFDLPNDATAEDLLNELVRRYPQASAFRDSLAVAVNMTYVKPDHQLSESDEVALIPPVSGG